MSPEPVCPRNPVPGTHRLTGLSATVANISGLQVASGNAYSEIVYSDLLGVPARLHDDADVNAKWFAHRLFYFSVMYKSALALGGASATEMLAGIIARRPTFLGYPVEFTAAMPKAEANSQVCALLGDLGMAAMIGDRRQVTIEQSREAYFTSDQIGIRGTQRVAINVHSVGNADATAANRIPSPIVGLITANS